MENASLYDHAFKFNFNKTSPFGIHSLTLSAFPNASLRFIK